MKTKIVILSTILTLLLFGCKMKQKVHVATSAYFELVRQNIKGNVAYETTAYVEQFWRVVGNNGFNKTIDRISSKLEEAGYVLESNAKLNETLTYRIEKRAMQHKTWEPIQGNLTILNNNLELLDFSSNRNMIYINSHSTPSNGVVGEIVYIKNIEDLTPSNISGKIIFTELNQYTILRKYKTIVESGALGLISYNNPSYLQPEKNPTSIQFRNLPYSDNTTFWGIALSYESKEKLKTALEKEKVNVRVTIQTKIYPSEELTIIANVKGSDLPDESLVFSAHIQEPGANDNASGVGAQLEMAMTTAKLINSKKLNLKRTLTFLWGDEIVSTRRYIEEKEKRNRKINWGISLDMVGENTSKTGGSFLIEKMPDPSAIWTRGNDKHTEWGGEVLTLEDMKPHYFNDFIIEVFKIQGKYASWEVKTNPFEGGSDHTPFLSAEIPGLLLWHFTDQFYHTDNDRIDKVSKETLKNVSISALVSAYILCNANYSTAKDIIKTILAAAKVRLNEEYLLSKKALSEGKTIEDETQIITTWNSWYIEALKSIEDLVPKPTEKLKTEIINAEKMLQHFTNELIKDLKN